MHKPMTGRSDAHARRTTGHAGPLDGNPAPRPLDDGAATGPRRVLATTTRALHLAPRPETAVRPAAARHARNGARPVTGRRLHGPIPGQLALFDPRRSGYRAALAGLGRAIIRQDRSIAILVGGLVLLALVTAAIPSTGSAAAIGATSGLGYSQRLPVGGTAMDGSIASDGAGPDGAGQSTTTTDGGLVGVDAGIAGAPAAALTQEAPAPAGEPVPAASGQGAFLADGTLLKPIAVDTSVPDAASIVKTYRVKPGDTLTGIAAKFRVQMMTLWWANNLKSKDALKPGMKLKIPPDDGILVKVKEGDSLDRIARLYEVDPAQVQKANDLKDDTLFIGQTIFVPGAYGNPYPTPKPTARPRTVTGNSNPGGGGNFVNGGGDTTPSGPVRYGGGRMDWPVAGGGNYISQYYHYGHPALDIAGSYGSPVVAAAGGRVIFAGWRSNGGGYQVWISHGNGVYTTYNHLSSVSVGAGQTVGAGQRIGSLGQSGWATGPHLHFEVWSAGVPVDPLSVLPARP